MAITALTWCTVTIAPLATPPWTSVATQISGPFMDALIAGSTMFAFCVSIDATYTEIAYLGGTVVVPNACLSFVSNPAMDTSAMEDGETWYSVRQGASWMYYGSSSGIVRKLAISNPLGVFIT